MAAAAIMAAITAAAAERTVRIPARFSSGRGGRFRLCECPQAADCCHADICAFQPELKFFRMRSQGTGILRERVLEER